MNQQKMKVPALPFALVRAANAQRMPLFKNGKGELCHGPKARPWSKGQWLQAIAGEMGEYANIRKKFDRGDIDAEEFKVQAGKELADVFIYTDLFAHACGIAIESVVPARDFDRMQAIVSSFPEQQRIASDQRLIAETFMEMTHVLAKMAKRAITSGELVAKARIASPMLEFVARIFLLAEVNGVDLGSCVAEKFNETSEKMGVPVFIRAIRCDDDGSNSWQVCDIPF